MSFTLSNLIVLDVLGDVLGTQPPCYLGFYCRCLKIVSIENSLRNQTQHAYNSQKWTTITLQDYTYSADWAFNLFLRVLWTKALFLEISKRIYFRTYRDYPITNESHTSDIYNHKQTNNLKLYRRELS